MGYDRNDRRYGRDQGQGSRDQDRDYGRQAYGRQDDYARGYQSGDRAAYGRQSQGYDDDRGFFDRAGDEVRSWFGDEEAERRRRYDEQQAEREYRLSSGRGDDRARGSYGAYGRDDRSRSEGGRSYGESSGYGAGSYAGSSAASGYDAGRGAGEGSAGGRDSWTTDHGYKSWRDKQVESLDRDYEDYRREHQSKFEQEFHGWRQNRQTQRDALGKVKEHQEVVGSDGQHVGTVDKVRGDRIILTKKDADAGGHHHSIPVSWIQSVDDKVTISRTADDAHGHWRDEERNSAFGQTQGQGARDRDDRGQTNLNRSFSGTY